MVTMLGYGAGEVAGTVLVARPWPSVAVELKGSGIYIATALASGGSPALPVTAAVIGLAAVTTAAAATRGD